MALQLRRRGITRIRPLRGGLEGWRELGLPLEPWAAATRDSADLSG
ncbi:MAG: hypothetical protein AB7O97_18870 [Planctomycetota bacterium]